MTRSAGVLNGPAHRPSVAEPGLPGAQKALAETEATGPRE